MKTVLKQSTTVDLLGLTPDEVKILHVAVANISQNQVSRILGDEIGAQTVPTYQMMCHVLQDVKDAQSW